jgi:hypothetical protein
MTKLDFLFRGVDAGERRTRLRVLQALVAAGDAIA